MKMFAADCPNCQHFLIMHSLKLDSFYNNSLYLSNTHIQQEYKRSYLLCADEVGKLNSHCSDVEYLGRLLLIISTQLSQQATSPEQP
jgi:hypothetical protein